ADAVHEDDLRQPEDGSVVPQVDAGDWRRFELTEVVEIRLRGDVLRRQKVEQPVKRRRGDIPRRFQAVAVAKLRTADAPAVQMELFAGRICPHLDLELRQPSPQLFAVQSAERHAGQLDLEAAAVGQEAVHKHLAGVAQADAVGRFVQRAGQYQAPEAV